nr:hypothetical protein [Tanacetum cinerariifolium]
MQDVDIAYAKKEIYAYISQSQVSDLNASLQEKVLVITDLKEQLNKLKGKAIVTEAVSLNPIDPELLKIEVAPLAPKLCKNRTTHTDYIRHTLEEAATLREIVKRVTLVFSASGSMSQDNTKKNRIQRTQRKAKKNKLEDHLRTVSSSLNKKSVIDTKATSSVTNLYNGTQFINQTLRDYYEEVGISHETSVARSSQQNGVVERRNRTLIEASRTIENLGKLQPKADIGIFISYAPTKKAFRIYNRRTRRIVETIHVDFDELTAMASKQISSGPAFNEMNPATLSSGLVQKSSPSTPFVPPSRNDWDLLFQPLFDELLNPPPSVDNQAPKVTASIPEVIPPIHDDSTGSPSSTTVDQDAPSLSESHTTAETQSSVIPQDVEEENLDIKVAHMGNDPLLGVSIPAVISAQSSTRVSPHHIVQPDHPIPQHIRKWTKDHPLNNIIGQLSRPVSTRLQLHEQALFCYYDAFLTSVEPKTYKDALTQSCWIEAMQEELNEFERLEISQSPRGIFINQSKYALESLKKYGFESCDPVDTPMVEKSKLDEDKEGKAVDPSHYR